MFNVFRSQEAMLPLQATWEQASESFRASILSASREVDRQLQAGPQGRGESRDNGRRVLFVWPLGVLFEVDERARTVRVLRAWSYVPAGADRPSAWDV
jgi:hypothetical protein